ncbi:hypothetical protein [Sorangium cellulosum]|uniref:hypothetical protein n=1 Tax=Sorangium cellulosum TaxID=56 RepID=UPI0010133259|nr:hypothetical protein [Sorangium cellulosum]
MTHGERRPQEVAAVDLGLLDIDELARSGRQERHEHRQALRDAEADVRDAHEILRAAACSLLQTADAQLDAGIVDARCLDGPVQAERLERGPELLQADVLRGLPVMDDAGDVRLEGAGELAPHGGGPVRPLGNAAECGDMDDGAQVVGSAPERERDMAGTVVGLDSAQRFSGPLQQLTPEKTSLTHNRNNVFPVVVNDATAQPVNPAESDGDCRVDHVEAALGLLLKTDIDLARRQVNADRELIAAPSVKAREELLDRREADMRAVEQQRPRVVERIQRLLHEQRGLHDAGLARAVGAGEERQRPDGDLRTLAE